MKRIKINFSDFASDFDKYNNYFYKVLSEKYKVEITEKPDYLIYSVFGVKHREYSCVKIFYTGECVTPDFNHCDYAMGFDYIEFGDRYCRFPIYLYYSDDFRLARQKHEIETAEMGNKTGFCSFCYSNAGAKQRIGFFKKLNRYKKVDSGGKVLNNIGYYVGGDRHVINDYKRNASKIEWQSKYKFCVAFENTSFPGYTTEKIVQAFASKTVPIYWGDPLVTRDFNEESFINCHDYASFDEIIDKIKQIDEDDALYMKMLKAPAFKEECLGQEQRCKEFLWRIMEDDKPRRLRKMYREYDDEVFQAKQILLQEVKFGKPDTEFVRTYAKEMIADWVLKQRNKYENNKK